MESKHAQRKNEHLSLATKLYEKAHENNPFDEMHVIHHSLPEISLNEIDPNVNCGPFTLTSPFYIEAMTGGSQNSYEVNRDLALIAAKYGLAMALGSSSIIFRDPASITSFKIAREVNPDGLIFANLSAKASVEQAQQVCELLQADALELHINTAQELVMADGDQNFHWLKNIEKLVKTLPVPVIVKEVGFGMDQSTIQKLQSIGVQFINISGRGGTNFAAIEDRRNHKNDFSFLNDWGQTTIESLLEARAVNKNAEIFASGGITSPLDVIKSGILGAKAVGVAGFFLHLLVKEGPDQLEKEIQNWQIAIPRLLALVGCHNFSELSACDFVLHGNTLEYAQQRNLI